MLAWAILVSAMVNVENHVWQMVLISLAISIHQLEMSCGFFISHSDLVGPYSGAAFGITNTLAQGPGFLVPLLVAYLAPNVSLISS